VKCYKVTARFGSDTVKFNLPPGLPQATVNEALVSARIESAKAFGFEYRRMVYPETLKVTVTEQEV